MKRVLSAMSIILLLVSCTKPEYLNDFRPKDKVTVKEITKSGKNKPAVIFLDFDGGAIIGTDWNLGTNADSLLVGHSGLTSTQMQYIYDSVSYDYKDFNVTVTTNESIYKSAPANKRVRVMITQSWEWYGNLSGGVSFTNSFGRDQPVFIFSSLFGFNTKPIAEACSHEAGHTFGLFHQSRWENGVLMDVYNDRPQADGQALIMGKSYAYPGRFGSGINQYGNFQDDIAIIKATLAK